MQWFNGNVTTAIHISRKNRALLIVYITTDTEDGKLFDEFWQHIEPSNLLCPVVGIKLKEGETAAQQFADIYPTPILPAAYLIDQNGKPLEVITTLVGKTYDQFRSKFDKATTQFVNANPSPGISTTQTVSPQPVETPNSVLSSALSNTRIEPTPVSTTSQQMTPELTAKIARAKALLEEKKQKDVEKRNEAEKQQKHELAKAREAKQERDDKALIEAAKLRRKEKLEAEREKSKILEQIKADRKDAQKRLVNENTGNSQTEGKTGNSFVGKSVPSDRCRLQVRLPDGSTFVEEFPSNDVLNSLVEIIRQKPSMGSSNFEIQQPYPRRVFTIDDYSKTFLENELTPSTALVVLQKSSGSSYISSSSNAVAAQTSSIFSLVLSPVWLLWNYFCGFFGWNSTESSAQRNNDSRKQDGSSNANQPGRRGMPRTAEVRRRGNIAGLENPNDDDPEERASFNGNSTQFM